MDVRHIRINVKKALINIYFNSTISLCFFYGTRWYYEYFNNYWYVRPIGFGMATIVFGLLTWVMLGEAPDTRTWISIVLSVVIILIQLSHLFVK